MDFKCWDLFDEMFIVWVGEFGCMFFLQGGNGWDYNFFGFSVWMVGGGICGGLIYGVIDEFGYYVVDKFCSVYDLWVIVFY